MAPNSMNAMRIHEYGNSNVLVYEMVEIPKVNENGLLIKVNYTSVNPMDRNFRAGYMKDLVPLKMPAILGADVAGVVEQVGTNVKKFKVGDKVICSADFYTKGGSYAEYVSVDENAVALAPERIPLKEAAGLPIVASTALEALFDIAKIRKGQKVLIIGASGGVGSMGVQIAKSVGAYVIGTTSKANVDMVMSLGADEVIDYTAVDFSQKVKDADVVFETVGGETFQKSLNTVKKGGILVTTLGRSIILGVTAEDKETAKKLGITVTIMRVSVDGPTLDRVVKLVDEGRLKVLIDKEFQLKEIKAAHDLSQSGKVKGKIIIKVA